MEITSNTIAHENDELFKLIRSQMTKTDEELFITSYYLYLQYGKDNTAFVIDFDIVWKDVQFSRKDAAKHLLIKKFNQHIDYKIIEADSSASGLTEQKLAPDNYGASLYIEKNHGG